MRLLITSNPGRGHVYPALAVGDCVRRAGHDVAVATGPAYEQMVRDAALPFFRAGVDWNQATGLRPLWGEATTTPFAADLDRIVGEWQPDIILREETEVAGWVVADAHDLPVATLGLGGSLPPRAYLRAEEQLNALRVQMGAPPDPGLQSIHRYLYLDQYPAGWVPPELQAPNYHNIGAAVMPAAQSEPAARGEETGGDRPHIYVTLGTVHAREPQLLQTILDALGSLGVGGTVTLGPAGDPEALSAPPRVRLAHFIPQEQLLPRTDAVICHAGTGTTLGALRHDLPLVLIPFAANQGWTAELAHRNGVARRLLGDKPRQPLGPGLLADLETLRAEEVAAAVQEVLADDAYRTRAAAAGRDLRQRWESGIVVTLLEQLAAIGAQARA